jgi:hypothetical protein
MDIAVHVRIAGLCLLAVAALNVALPARLGWKEGLAKLDLLNRQIFLVHWFFIAFTVAMMGCLALFWTTPLLDGSALARASLAGLSLFWGARLAVQVFVYDRRLWRGSRLRTCVHAAMTCLWAYLTAVFACALWRP